MGDAEIKKLYDYSEKLDDAVSKGEISQHEELYRNILKSAKGGPNAKKLVAQLIPRYLKHFPQTSGEAIDSLTDLCEEEDVAIRVLGVRAFPMICKDNPSVIPKAAYILGQLLQSESHVELDNVKQSLISIFRLNARDTLDAIFNQIQSREEKQKTKALQFLKEKFSVLKDDFFNKDKNLTESFVGHVQQSLDYITFEEFQNLLGMLIPLKSFTEEQAQEISNNIITQANLSLPFKATDHARIDKIVSSMQMMTPLFKKGVSNTQFVKFFIEKVLPVFDQINEENQFRFLEAIASMAPFTTDDCKAMMSPVHNLFQKRVPSSPDEPFQPNHKPLECLLYFVHQVGSKAPNRVKAVCGLNVKTIFTGQPSDFDDVVEASEEKRQDFLKRLKTLYDRNEEKIKQVNESLKTETEKQEELKQELRARENIREMIKNLQKEPPTFQSKISLSWQPQEKGKRKENPTNTLSTGEKRPKGVYVPPRGGRGQNRPRGGPPKRGGFNRGRGGSQRGRGGGRRGRY